MENTNNIIRFIFVGDIALGNHPKTPGFGFYSKYIEGIPLELISRIKPNGYIPDVFFGNLEFCFASEHKNPDSQACCIGSASYRSFLKKAGLTVLNLANNHSWQYGKDIFLNTVMMLQNEGIKVIGIQEDFVQERFIKIKGITIAILGCSARPRQGFNSKPGYNEFEKDTFLNQIAGARKNADIILVSIHWGDEFILIPDYWERELAHLMIEAGANMVIGHHPHVVREIEIYRDGIIAYSLGNFIGDMTWNPLTKYSGCLVVETKGSIINYHAFNPAVIRDDYFPEFLNKEEKENFFEFQIKSLDLLREDLNKFSYDYLAKKALKKHQWLTFGFLFRNFFRYRLSTLIQILLSSLKDRLNKGKR